MRVPGAGGSGRGLARTSARWQAGAGARHGRARLRLAFGPAAPAGVLGRRRGHGLRRGGAVHSAVQGHPEDSECRRLLHLRVSGAPGGQYFTDTVLVSWGALTGRLLPERCLSPFGVPG